MEEQFETYRPLLFSIAYRMTGSASDAEDLVQETYLRATAAPHEDIRSPKAYLSKIITNLCLDYLKSARTQREQYIGPWLPEPLLTSDERLAPLATVEQRESISFAFLVLLESLTPPERAVLLLHDVFDYSYEEIARIIGKSAANCRQLLHRARKSVAERRLRFEPSAEQQRQIIGRFLVACQQGDVNALTEVLAREVTSWSDGGGKVAAATQPIFGQEKVIRLLLGLMSKAPADLTATAAQINGGLAIVLWVGGALYDVITFDIADGQIQNLRFVLNPDKLAYLAQQLQAVTLTPEQQRALNAVSK
jgi:RNA polymerase sigma-70 factor, ECF subfamily